MTDRPSSPIPARTIFQALPGYPFYPCQACIAQGFKVSATGCFGDHTVYERAKAMHPGLVFGDDNDRTN